MGFDTNTNSLYIGDSNGDSKLVGAPLPLSIANGGTGNTTGLAVSATKLATARTIRTNLASTSTASFNGTADINPGVTGVLPIANGGTGKTTAENACYALTNGQILYPKAVTTLGGSFSYTDDFRGVLKLYNPTETGDGDAIKMYANISSGGEIDVYEGTGSTVLASLFASTAGRGVLQLSDGTNPYQLTPEGIEKANNAIRITELWTANASDLTTAKGAKYMEIDYDRNFYSNDTFLIVGAASTYNPMISCMTLAYLDTQVVLQGGWGDSNKCYHRQITLSPNVSDTSKKLRMTITTSYYGGVENTRYALPAGLYLIEGLNFYDYNYDYSWK